MLASRHRIRTSTEFGLVVRRGGRARGHAIVVYVLLTGRTAPPRCGFVVGKAVGIAPVRNTVKRRLRHLMRDHVKELPCGSMVVVRALPASAGLAHRKLESEVAGALSRAMRRAEGSETR